MPFASAATLPVALASCADYAPLRLVRTVGDLFTRIGYHPGRGERVLVKPNLLRADPLTCTHPQLVRAACLYLLDHGCAATVGDSPGFGSGAGVAARIGLDAALRDLPGGIRLPVITLNNPRFAPLPQGGRVALSRAALEADSILNIPRLKAHSQLRLTCGVKNLFGCVVGLRKAWLHAAYGDKGNQFVALVVAIAEALPLATTLVDAVTAMDGTGPSGGNPFQAELLAASPSPVAADTAIYGLMGLEPATVPLWRELQRRRIPGACAEEISLLGEDPSRFSLEAFQLPPRLRGESFAPAVLARSAVRRLWARWRS